VRKPDVDQTADRTTRRRRAFDLVDVAPVLLAMAGVLSMAACSGRGQTSEDEAPPGAGPNVILVLVDTLRADHLGCYGWPRATSPGIDAFAEDAVLFERARSQASCTFPSVNSMLTSRYGALFMFQPEKSMAIPADKPVLPEILRDEGYATAAFSASPIVRATPSSENPDAGFGRGFDFFDESCLFRDADCINQRALRWVRRTERPFFLYLHYMEPHDPYAPPSSHRRRFAGDFDGPDHIRRGDPNPIADMVYGDGPDVEIGEHDLDHLLDLYDEEIAYLDSQFTRLMEELEALGALEGAIVILASDHGEEFMEHGDHVKHCRVLFDTSTRVPLIMRIPGVAGRRIDTAVANLDIMPTVLDYLGIPTVGMLLNGQSLRPLIEAGETERRVVFSDQGRWRSADDGDFKLLFDGVEMRPELFDLAADPLELTDVLEARPEVGGRLWKELETWLVTTEGGAGNREALEAGKETQERLRALGYLQ
jgi:arylsulfatase A-like enzyme